MKRVNDFTPFVDRIKEERTLHQDEQGDRSTEEFIAYIITEYVLHLSERTSYLTIFGGVSVSLNDGTSNLAVEIYTPYIDALTGQLVRTWLRSYTPYIVSSFSQALGVYDLTLLRSIIYGATYYGCSSTTLDGTEGPWVVSILVSPSEYMSLPISSVRQSTVSALPSINTLLYDLTRPVDVYNDLSPFIPFISKFVRLNANRIPGTAKEAIRFIINAFFHLDELVGASLSVIERDITADWSVDCAGNHTHISNLRNAYLTTSVPLDPLFDYLLYNFSIVSQTFPLGSLGPLIATNAQYLYRYRIDPLPEDVAAILHLEVKPYTISLTLRQSFVIIAD